MRGPVTRAAAATRAVVGDVRSLLRGRDLAMLAGGTTFFSVLAVVPWLLVALWGAGVLSSPAFVAARLADLRLVLPPGMGARGPYDVLVAAAPGLGVLGALVALFPATFYGEGLRRACLRLTPCPDRFTGWRARLAVLPLAVVVPVLALGILAGAPLLADLARTGGVLATGAQVVVGFHLSWVAVGVVLTWVFRVVAPGTPGPVATLVGAFSTSAVVSGFLQGFLLFLALPIDLGIPFGGLAAVGAVVAMVLWLFVLHLLVLVGWAATTALDRRLRAPSALPTPSPTAPSPTAEPPAPAVLAGHGT